jgi:hypothetical protein
MSRKKEIPWERYPLEYVAGLFDGEGCIQICKVMRQEHTQYMHTHLVVTITSSYLPVILQLKRQFGGHKIRVKKSVNYKTYWHWMAECRLGEDFLSVILPFLVIKKEQAILALKYRKTFKHTYKGSPVPDTIMQIRDDFRNQIRTLNKRCFEE